MNTLINSVKNGVLNFSRDEEGAQIVEYALIVAVVSIALVLALKAIADPSGTGPFSKFIARITTCLTTAACV